MTSGRVGRPPKEIVFDHSAPATVGGKDGVKFLVQNKRRWSYAEYNRFSKKYEPEPRLIDGSYMADTGLAFQVKELKSLLSPVIEQMDRLKGVADKLDDLLRDLENG